MAEQTNLEKQVEQLIEQVNTLTLRVFVLERNATQSAAHPDPLAAPPARHPPENEPGELPIAGNSLLPRMASVCFLLVIALGLRTMTDSAVLNPRIGSLLGMVYASALIFSSGILYARQNILAPIFNFCGAVLMFSVILETHTHFEAFPKEVAYLLMALTGIGLAFISHARRVASPILTGTLGMCLAGVALDFPAPYFPYLALLLWLANILGFFASRIKHCSWLRWLLLGITLTMLQVWGLRIGLAPLRGEALEPLAAGWFLPMAAIISFTYLSISLIGILRSGEQRISKFDFSLPTVTACYGFLVGMYILKGSTTFSLFITVVAAGLLAVAYLLSRRQISRAPGTNSFTLAGVLLLSFSLPLLFNSLLPALPILSGLALLIAHLSHKWASGGMRITSYLLQVYTAAVLLIELVGYDAASAATGAILSAAICAAAGLAHYRFCRRTPPPAASVVFERLDQQDHSAVAVLLSGLAAGYAMAMFITFQVLRNVFGPSGATAYACIQTATINLAAISIMALALNGRNRELRNVAILIMMVGGAKAFLIDLFSISGLGLVISIFSFGIAVSFESFALSRWQKLDEAQQKQQSESEPQRAATRS